MAAPAQRSAPSFMAPNPICWLLVKGLAGGYAAIAGVFGRQDIANAISEAGLNVMFHTFGALPQSCAAATAVLQILREENLIQRADVVGQKNPSTPTKQPSVNIPMWRKFAALACLLASRS